MPSVQGDETMRAWGSRYARLVLEKSDRNKRQACDVLDISYHTLNAYLNYQPREKARRCGRPSWRKSAARRSQYPVIRRDEMNRCHGDRRGIATAGASGSTSRRRRGRGPRSRAARTRLRTEPRRGRL